MEKRSELTVTCPKPRTLATGELECPLCGSIWDRDEEPPRCRRPDCIPGSQRKPHPIN